VHGREKPHPKHAGAHQAVTVNETIAEVVNDAAIARYT
jgi:hypothetical protein